jgi:diacylglycerol kinase (ATP)
MRLLLLYNPEAGKGRAHRHIAEAVARLQAHGAEVELEPSRSPEHLIELGARATSSGAERIVACGGDGTVNLVLRRLDLDRATLGILPLGSGDDFAKTVGIPADLEGACEVLLGGRVRPIDVAMANDVRYVCVAGFGFDSEVNRVANESRSRLRGTPLYLTSILKVLRKFEPHHVSVQNGASRWSQEMMFLVVANSPRYGAGIHIAPHAVPDDGLLDLCVVGKCGKMELVRTLPLAYSGGHLKRSFVHYQKGTEFSFQTGEPMDVYADGEPVTRTPVHFSINPQKLRLLVPAAVA